MFHFGNRLQVQVFGQSHSPAMGVVMDNFPAGMHIDSERLAAFMERRAPGRDAFSTRRREPDAVEFLSGVVEDVTTGAPICAMIRNTDTRSRDYDKLADVPRPAHADLTAYFKYGNHRDHRGGGEFSGRLTAPVCVAGYLAMLLLKEKGIRVGAHIASVGDVFDDVFSLFVPEEELYAPGKKAFPVLNDEKGLAMQEVILQAKGDADSVGGSIECAVTGLPVGVGGGSFDGLEGRIALAAFGIPAVKGIEFGSGFCGCGKRGSENNDAIRTDGKKIYTETNNAGGILGGITNGMPVVFRVGIKPTPSIGKVQKSVSLSRMENTELTVQGRHDPCIVPRAVPVVEAIAALAVADCLL
jgi:chorismate synthase